MPVPAIPALTAAARFLLAKGTREAVKKYGQAAVTKAKALLKKRRPSASSAERYPESPQIIAQRAKIQELADSLPQQTIKAVKKPTFKKGDKVRGAGIASQGVRPCKIV
jgi:hypothetical protein